VPITTPDAMVTVGFAERLSGGAASTVQKQIKEATAVKSVVVYMIVVGEALLCRYTQAINKQSKHGHIPYTGRGALLVDNGTALMPVLRTRKKRLVYLVYVYGGFRARNAN
jgi:hypothetical protein